MTWPQVREQPVQAFEGVLSQGFGTGVIWLKLRIDPQLRPELPRQPDRLVLRIRPVYLDKIAVFDPLVPGGLAGVTGDHIHPRDQDFEGLDFMLPIARGEAPRDIWLRLESTSTRQIIVQAFDENALLRVTQTEQLLFAVYIGVILVFMVWGLVYWLFSREEVIGAFALKQAAALVFALGSLGYSRAYWPAGWPAHWLDANTSLSGCVAVSAAIYFHVTLLREFAPPPWTKVLQGTLLAMLPVKLALLLLGGSSTVMALRINMLEVMLAPSVFLLSALLASGWRDTTPRQRPMLAQWVVVGFYGLLVLMLLLAALPGLGLMAGGEVPLYLVQAHGLVTAFLILLMLQYRAHAQQRQQRETALTLERTELQAQQERRIREEQEKLLAMLAHELKTPLATMQMRLDPHATGSREMRYAIRDMNAVIERCVQTQQLVDRQLQAEWSEVDLTRLVSDAVASCVQPDRIELQQPILLFLQTDRQLLFIVLSNLLENACKYAAPHTPIVLRLSKDERCAMIEICNTPGHAGLPDADKLFDKYYRSPHARRQAGTGLGLYLVRNLVQVLGGRINYAPDARYVRFVLSLPLDGKTPLPP